MGIFDQAKSLFDGSRYVSKEGPRIAESIARPVDADRHASLMRSLREGRIEGDGPAERILMSMERIEREMAQGDHPGYVRRAEGIANAVLRTTRDLEEGRLPDDPKTLLNRTMLDISYQRDADWETRVRAGAKRAVYSGAENLVLSSGGALVMRGMDDAELKAVSSGVMTGAPAELRAAFGRDAAGLAVSGSRADMQARMPKRERAVDVSVLAEMSKSAGAVSR